MIPRPGTSGAPAQAAAYVYLLQSRADGTYYVGWATDPVRRLVEHNTAPSAYTRSPRRLARFKKRVLNRSRLLAGPCQGVG